MNWLKRTYNKICSYWTGLFWGLKSTNDEIFTQTGISTPVGITINQQVNENRVSKDLLKGEITQQVEELRYRTYKVDREAKQFEYFSPLKAIKFDKQDSKFVKYENDDKLPLITIQPNHSIIANVYDGIKDVDFMKADLIDEQANVSINVGKFDVDEKYIINIDRDFMPRFKIERYTTRLVIRKLDDKDNVMLDFYVSKYPQEKDMKSIYFVKEVEKLANGDKQSDITNMNMVSFVTSHAYGLNDMLQFKFNHIYYKTTIKFDGHYVIRFRAHMFINGKDLTDEYYSKSMDEKYRTKEKKDIAFDLTGGSEYETFVCQECGKVVEYNTDTIDEMDTRTARDITDEAEANNESVISYMDLQISEQTFGKRLCKDCLAKYLNNMNKK